MHFQHMIFSLYDGLIRRQPHTKYGIGLSVVFFYFAFIEFCPWTFTHKKI